jgi:hypothetical protein
MFLLKDFILERVTSNLGQSKLDIALSRVSKLSTIESARRWNDKQVKPGLIFHGDDDKFWVSANLADGSVLQKAGYEVVK